MYFNHNLNWYSVLEHDGYFEREKVELKISIEPAEEWECDQNKIYFTTNISEKSFFIYGTVKELPDKMIQGNPNIIRMFDENLHFYPGESLSIGYHENFSYYLNATGCVDTNFVNHCSNIKDYKLRISMGKKKAFLHQDLLSSLKFKGECNMPTVKFVGDLDGDMIPDIMLNVKSFYSGYILFLSSYRKDQEILRKVASYFLGGCDG